MKLEIKRLVLEDVEFLNEVRNECRQFLHNPTAYTYYESVDWFNKLQYPYYIVLMDDVRIGYFRTSNWRNDSVYIGADFHKNFRGRGLAKAAYYLFLDHLFHYLHTEKVYLEVLITNDRALNLYLDLGFKEIARTEDSIKMEKVNGTRR